ncbi:hypothetical protein Avbf_04714 [Armadillidium vulgare]|nr:hypothetical protein Avbf_04714 [Armadillidium vulgare]
MLEGISFKLDESDKIIHNSLDGASYIADDAECYKIQRAIRNQINMATEYLNFNKKSSKGSSTPCSPKRSSCCSGNHNKPELYRPPQKKLPIFSGEILQFDHFLEVFESIVEGRGYENVTKLEVLFDCLKGNALNLVSGYSLVGDNYEIVLNLLKKDFGNKAKVIETLILKLNGLHPPKYNYDELYKFKADVYCCVESLKTKGIIGDCNSCSIIFGSLLPENSQEIKIKYHGARTRKIGLWSFS